jgi:hypothetical protein
MPQCDSPPRVPALLERFASATLRPDEQVRYVARPGLRALPAGSGAVLGFAVPQLLLFAFLLWAIWWPWPTRTPGLIFSITLTVCLFLLTAGVIWLMLRGGGAIVAGVAKPPFIRLTVTDQRVIWSLPWTDIPLMEIEQDRVLGGALGEVDQHGQGNAAIILRAGDPAADEDGYIHIDRLPNVAGFVAALARLG